MVFAWGHPVTPLQTDMTQSPNILTSLAPGAGEILGHGGPTFALKNGNGPAKLSAIN
jgi:hypothetical protein